MEFAAALWVQKHGAKVSDLAVVILFVVGTIPAFIAVVRYDRFLRAGGKIREQVKRNPLSTVFLCLLLLMVSCSTITTLVRHTRQQVPPAIATSQQPQKPAAPLTQQPAASTPSAQPKQTPQKSPLAKTVVPMTPNISAPATLPQGAVTGSDNTIVNDPRSIHGDGNTIVGADANRNVFIPAGTAIGRDAHADPTSVAIGAGAGAGNTQSSGSADCPNNAGNCAGVNNGTQVTNQYGPTPFSLSDDQIKTASAKFSKLHPPQAKVNIMYEWSAPDGEQAAKHLQAVLLSAGINASIGGCGMCINYPGAPAYSGISFAPAGSPILNKLADDIEAALKDSGAVSEHIKRDNGATGSATLDVYIRKP